MAQQSEYMLVGAIGVPFFAALLGFIVIARQRLDSKRKAEFGHTYRERFIRWANGNGADAVTFNWLTLNANRMQSEMGRHGVYGEFRPPYANYAYKNYPIILNMIPQMRTWMLDDSFGRRLFSEQVAAYGRAVDEALLRYIGSVDHSIEQAINSSRNPFLCLRIGIEQIMIVPLRILSWFGIVGDNSVRGIEGSAIFRLSAGIVALTGFVASIATIAVGWESIGVLWQKLFPTN